MHKQSPKAFDTHNELLVQRYRDGFTLVKPSSSNYDCSTNSVASIFNLPFAAYFLDSGSHFIDSNIETATLVGRETVSEMQGCTSANFCSREFSDRLFEIDNSIVQNQTSRLIEETGFRRDDFLIQVLSLKLPWYHDGTIIGLLGFSIKSDTHSLPKFADNMLQLISTGLLGTSESTAQAVLPKPHAGDVYLSKREKEVMSYLVRGKTAKEIALLMNRSRRTVEHHIVNIKQKSQCHSKSALIDKFFDDFS